MLVHTNIDYDRTFNRLDHVIKRNRSRRARQRISAARTPLGLYQSPAYQILNNFLQEFSWNSLLLGNLGYGAASVRILARKIDDGTQPIVDPTRNLHEAHNFTPLPRYG